MSGLLDGQPNVSGLTPMPTERVDDTSVAVAVAAETVTFYSVNSGVWTASGSHAIAAGDIVAGKLAYTGVLNSLKSNLGHFNDTSFAFDSGSGLTAKMATPLESQMSKILAMTPTEQVAYLANYIPTAGRFFIDHRRGIIFGKSVNTTGSQPASYAYSTPLSGGGTGDSVNVIKVGGVAIPTAGADGVSNTRSDVPTSARVSVFNGTTWDRWREGALANGSGMVEEQGMSTAEDNVTGLFAMALKYSAASTYAGTKTQNNSFTTSNLKATAGTVVRFTVTNTTASTRYFQLHNTATTPGGGATAQEKFLVPANSSITLNAFDLGAMGAYFATGIAYANSTVLTTYTAGSAGDLVLDIVHF